MTTPNTTEQELREKLSQYMYSISYDDLKKQATTFNGQTIGDHFDGMFDLITQYGDTREREGRIDENRIVVDAITKGDSDYVSAHYHSKRLTELKEKTNDQL